MATIRDFTCGYGSWIQTDSQVQPLKMGDIFHIVMGPTEANCPKAISKNSMGKPAAIRATRYGNRKAPEK